MLQMSNKNKKLEDIFRLKLVYYVATLSHGNKCILRINYL